LPSGVAVCSHACMHPPGPPLPARPIMVHAWANSANAPSCIDQHPSQTPPALNLR
jgi:hypothetical protein